MRGKRRPTAPTTWPPLSRHQLRAQQPELRRTGARAAAAGAVPPVARRAFTSLRFGAQKSGAYPKRGEGGGIRSCPAKQARAPRLLPKKPRQQGGGAAASSPARGRRRGRRALLPTGTDGGRSRAGLRRALQPRSFPPPQAGAANASARPFPAAGAGAPGALNPGRPFPPSCGCSRCNTRCTSAASLRPAGQSPAAAASGRCKAGSAAPSSPAC